VPVLLNAMCTCGGCGWMSELLACFQFFTWMCSGGRSYLGVLVAALPSGFCGLFATMCGLHGVSHACQALVCI
jgi:hypothetical protein